MRRASRSRAIVLMGAIEFCSQTDAAVHAVDGPAPRVDRCVLGQGNDMQHSGANMLGPALWKRDSGWCSAVHRGLRFVPIDLEDNTITSITPTCLARAEPRARIAGPPQCGSITQ